MKIKKISIYGILSALCLVFGYVESLLPLNFLAPGIKLGLANGIALLLLAGGDFKGALLVNTARILLSALLFATPYSLIFSIPASLASLIIMRVFSNMKSVSVIGFSALGATFHNLTQTAIAYILYGFGVWYYLPFLLLSAMVTGGAIGAVALNILKKVKTKEIF